MEGMFSSQVCTFPVPVKQSKFMQSQLSLPLMQAGNFLWEFLSAQTSVERVQLQQHFQSFLVLPSRYVTIRFVKISYIIH